MAFSFSFKTTTVSSLISSLLYLTVSSSSVIVNSPFGKIKGEFVPGASSDQSYVLFRNIPYAKPPVGDLRFSKPVPHPKIDGVFDATNQAIVMCPQPGVVQFGTEDCLVLNIFAKSKSIDHGGKMKKVMLFIHGGGFIAGTSSLFNMSSFVTTHDVIGVTINYRLSILGFLSTGNEASPGNYGLWDQAMALKWIKDNIKAFGGDPDDVTISGESAGGTSVGYLSLSPAVRGLFTKACLQSGTATSAFGQAIDVQKHALKIAKHAKCWDGDITDKLHLQQSRTLLACLRNVELSVLTSYQFFILDEPMFAPTVDGDFVPRKPIDLLQDKSYLESVGFYDISYLVSVLNKEGDQVRHANYDMNNIIRQGNAMTEEEMEAKIAKRGDDMKTFYLRARVDKDETSSTIDDRIMDFYNRRNVGDEAHLDMASDLMFLIPSYDHLNAASKSKKCKSWFLYFNHYPAFMKGTYRGMFHSFDMMYWFDMEPEVLNVYLQAGIEGKMDDGDRRLKSMFSAVLAGFVKNGDPGLSLKDHLPCGWPTYDATYSYYLNFNLEPTVRRHLEQEKRDLWLKTIPLWSKKSRKHTEL